MCARIQTQIFIFTTEEHHFVSADRARKPIFRNLSFARARAYIKRLRTAVYRLLAKHTSGRKPTFSLHILRV